MDHTSHTSRQVGADTSFIAPLDLDALGDNESLIAPSDQNSVPSGIPACAVEAKQTEGSQRPWGHYETLALGERFQVKRIVVKPGGKLSLQSHVHRSEHWVVVSGSALVTVGENQTLLGENQSIYIPAGEIHRLENPGRLPLQLIEVQSGAYLGEDDIIRYEDIYDRAPKSAESQVA